MKLSYKKIFVLATLAALVLVLLPIAGPVKVSQPTASTESSSHPTGLSPLFSLKENVAFATSTPSTTQTAPSNNVISCLENPATCALYVVSFYINAIGSVFVAVGAWLVRLALSFNDLLFSSPTVQIGFGVSLALANLGFVLGIIIIAIATILRSQTYGVKKILWKLVATAILVNFGLVITSPIIAFSGSLTNYFISSSVGTYGVSASNDLQNYTAFVTNITSAMAPQIFNQPISSAQSASNAANSNCSALFTFAGFLNPLPGGTLAATAINNWTGFCQKLSTAATGVEPQPDVFWQMILSMGFSTVFILLMAIALFVLAVLLLVRYVFLGILLVLLPLAWLAGVFPQFSGEFKKWLSNFVKWTFFPPLAMFFIYLTLQTAALQVNNQKNPFAWNATQPAQDGPEAGVATTLSSNASNSPMKPTDVVPLLQRAADEVLLISLLFAGLMAASSLAGKAGSTVVGGAKAITGAVAGYAGRAAGRQGVKAAARAVPQQTMEKLQRGELMGGRFKRLQVAAGIGLGNVQRAGGSALVEQESGWARQHAADPAEAKRLLASGALPERQQIALLQQLSSQGRLDNEVTLGSGRSLADFADINEDRLKKSLGQGKLAKDIDKALGSDKTMRLRARAVEQAKLTGDPAQIAAAESQLDTATNTFFEGLNKGDISKSMNVDAVFAKPEDPMAQAQLRAIARNQQQLMPSILMKANGATIQRIADPYRTALDSAAKEKTNAALNSPDFIQKQQDVSNDYAARIAAAQANPDSVPEIKALKTAAQAKFAATDTSNAQSFTAAKQAQQQEESNAINTYIASLREKQRIEIEKMKSDVEQNIEKRYGRTAFDQAVANNTLAPGATAAQENPPPAPAPPPPPRT